LKTYATFEAYLQDKYYNEIFQAVKKRLLSKGRNGLDSYVVLDPRYLELDDIHVRAVSFSTEDGMLLQFNAAVEADVILKGMGKRDYEADMKPVWYSVGFVGLLNDGLSMVTITGVDDYHKEKFDSRTTLSRYLVPYLYAKDLEEEAEKFLEKYCREALKEPMPIPFDKLVENMGLEMYEAPLPDNIFGKMCFAEDTVDVFDEAGEIEEQLIFPGTILVNPNIFFMRNIGSRNNTIIHECIHWDRHKNFFEMQNLLSSGLKALECSVTEKKLEKDVGVEGALQWMEWQANALAPRILMPRHTTAEKLKEILSGLEENEPDLLESERMEKAIETLAKFFQVSKFAAKLRAIELGFVTAIGVWNYIDGAYTPSFSFDYRACNKDETYIIDYRNAAFEVLFDPDHRDVFENGDYVYVENKLCVDNPEYYYIGDDGVAHLTPYARQHVDKCCLKFKNTYKLSVTSGDEFYTKCALCKNIDGITEINATLVKDGYDKLTREEAEKIKQDRKTMQRVINLLANVLPGSFTGTLGYHMDHYLEPGAKKETKLTEMELGKRTLFSDRQIRTFRTDESAKKDITATCALCIGLKLYPDLSEDMVSKSGHNWTVTEEDYYYRFALRTQYISSIYEINRYLIAHGCRPWGGRSTGQ
jgi:hypothetical protein